MGVEAELVAPGPDPDFDRIEGEPADFTLQLYLTPPGLLLG